MIQVWTERFSRIEFVLVCALALILPILESPKNLAIFLLLLTWIAHRVVARDFTPRRPDWIETSLLFILAVCILSTALNWPLVNGFKGLKDTLVQVFIFWFIYRAGYSERQYLTIAAMVAVGVLIGLGWGVLEVVQGHRSQLQFHSAGIVTQSALYLSIALATTFAVAWTRPAALSEIRLIRHPALWWTAAVIMVIGLFLMASRGAILAVVVTYVIYALVTGRRTLWFIILGAMGLAVVLTLILPDSFNQSRWLLKTREMTSTGRLVAADQERVDNWRIAIARLAQGDAVIVGIGPRNFAAIDHTAMRFDPPLVIGSGRLNHAHNLYLNKLVEEGILGLAALLMFFGLIITRFVRDRRRGEWQHWKWFAGVGALTIPGVAGLFGTPWHQEHALLAMMVLAIYLAPQPPGHATQPS